MVFCIVKVFKGRSVCIAKDGPPVWLAGSGHGNTWAMTSRISHTTVDCADPYSLSRWWAQVLDYHEDPDDPNALEDEECLIEGDGPPLLFIKVPEPKSVKNRMHLDLRPTDRTRDEEIERVQGLGASFIADHRGIHGPGTGWVVLADPEGNEFCILRSDAELRSPEV